MLRFTTLPSSSSSSSTSSLSSTLFPTWHLGPSSGPLQDVSPFRFTYRQFSDIANGELKAEPVPSTSAEVTMTKKSSKKKFKKRVKSFFGKFFND
jgi:hypothetical protein